MEPSFSLQRGAGTWSFNANNTSQWYKLAISYDTGSAANDPVIYLDGSLISSSDVSVPVTFTDGGLAWNIGNRPDATRNWDGYMAEGAIWDVILAADEMAAVTGGFSPALIRPASLQEYIPLVRDVVSRELAAPTLVGTAVQPHPRVIYPRQAMRAKASAPEAEVAIMTAVAFDFRIQPSLRVIPY